VSAQRDVYVGLGSNLGDREQAIRLAVRQLAEIPDTLVQRVSCLYDTEPVGETAQPRFLNAAATGATTLEPRALLDELLAIERLRGRERPYRFAPRTLDLDLILYGDRIVRESGLEVPHPRFRERPFVLEPLADIAGDWQDPVTGSTISALRDLLRAHPS